MSRVLEDDHNKWMPRVTVGVAHERTLTAHDHLPGVPSIDQNLQSFTGNGDVYNERKVLEWDDKPQPNKQTIIPLLYDLYSAIRRKTPN